MDFPKSLGVLLNGLEVGGVHYTSEDANELFALAKSEMPELLTLSVTDKEVWSRELALIALWRAFLNTLPAKALEEPRARCRPVVEERLRHLLGETPEKKQIDAIMTIVKRLQRYQILKRPRNMASSFDTSRISHLRILKRQSHRCAICGYRFTDSDLDPDQSAGVMPNVDTPINTKDRSPRKLKRKAELDHIIPIYLGGDKDSNWQVLCASCNRGKSDLLMGFESRRWFGGSRLNDLSVVSPQLFYMVLYRDRSCSICARTSAQVELRVSRRDDNGADLYNNLKAHCIECLRNNCL